MTSLVTDNKSEHSQGLEDTEDYEIPVKTAKMFDDDPVLEELDDLFQEMGYEIHENCKKRLKDLGEL